MVKFQLIAQLFLLILMVKMITFVVKTRRGITKCCILSLLRIKTLMMMILPKVMKNHSIFLFLPPLPITLFFQVLVLRPPLKLNLAHSFADFAFPLYFAIPMHSPLSSFIVPLPVVLLGPYGGQYSQLGKAITKLSILDAHHFCLVSLSPFCPQIHWFSYGFTSPSCGLTL